MRKSTSSFEDLQFDINSPIVTASSLEAKDLISFLFDSNKKDNWFSSLTEKETFEKGIAIVYDRLIRELNRNIKFKIQFANSLITSKGQISIGNSTLASTIEQALYKMKEDIIKHKMGNAVKAPIVVKTLSFNMEIGSFVKYKGSTYIVTQFNENGTVQIYNPLLEGAAAKITVSKSNIEILSSKAKIVNYKEADYIVTPKGTIISLKSNKAMNWAENDGNRVAIIKLSKAGQEQKSQALKKIRLNFNLNNRLEIDNGKKTISVRKENSLGLAKGETGIQKFIDTGILITLRGQLTVDEAGGEEAILKAGSNDIEQGNWIEGRGSMFVYDIQRFEDAYKGTIPMNDFLSLPVEKQVVIIEQQLNC